MLEQEGRGREEGTERKRQRARRYAPHKIIPFITTIFTICSVSNIKTIIKEDALARTRRDNGRHYARIAQLQRHFYGRLFLRPLPLSERASAADSRSNQIPSREHFRKLHTIVAIISSSLAAFFIHYVRRGVTRFLKKFLFFSIADFLIHLSWKRNFLRIFFNQKQFTR